MDILSAVIASSVAAAWSTAMVVRAYYHMNPFRERCDELSKEVKKLEEKLRLTQCSEHYAKSSASDLARDLKRVQSQRDDYRKIAMTHEVNYAKPPDDNGTSWYAFKDKEYFVHPKDFLKMLEQDIKKIDCDTIALSINYVPIGVWWETMLRAAGNGTFKRNDNTSEKFSISRSGEPQRVIDSLKTFMETESNDFMIIINGQKVWRHDDDYVRFVVSCRAFKADPPKPEIRFVEVLRVEECPACTEHRLVGVPQVDKIDENKTPEEKKLLGTNSTGPN